MSESEQEWREALLDSDEGFDPKRDKWTSETALEED